MGNRGKTALLDYFIGEREHIRRDGQAKCFGGLEIDKQLELGQLHDRQIGGLLALENATYIIGAFPIGLGDISAITYQSARGWKIAGKIRCR